MDRNMYMLWNSYQIIRSIVTRIPVNVMDVITLGIAPYSPSYALLCLAIHEFTFMGGTICQSITGSDAKTKPVNEVNTEKPKGLDGSECKVRLI